MLMAAREASQAAVSSCARGSVTLPTAQMPGMVVRPCSSVLTNLPLGWSWVAAPRWRRSVVRDGCCGDEQCNAGDEATVCEAQAGECVVDDDESVDWCGDRFDVDRREGGACLIFESCPVGEQDDVRGPVPDGRCLFDGVGSGVENAEGLVGDLVAVAGGAVQDVVAPAGFDAFHVGKAVGQASREQQAACGQIGAVGQPEAEALVDRVDIEHLGVDEVAAVAGDLLATAVDEIPLRPRVVPGSSRQPTQGCRRRLRGRRTPPSRSSDPR